MLTEVRHVAKRTPQDRSTAVTIVAGGVVEKSAGYRTAGAKLRARVETSFDSVQMDPYILTTNAVATGWQRARLLDGSFSVPAQACIFANKIIPDLCEMHNRSIGQEGLHVGREQMIPSDKGFGV